MGTAGRTAWAAVDLGQEPVDEVGERLHRVARVRWDADLQRVLDQRFDWVEAAGAEQHAAVALGHSFGGCRALALVPALPT